MPQNQAAYFDQIRKETMSPVTAVSRYRALGIRTGVFRSTNPCLQRGRERIFVDRSAEERRRLLLHCKS